MWRALKAVHETRGHQTVINYIRVLFRCSVEEGADIPKHLEHIKGTWERINALGSEHFRISDLFFKIIIASSLPPSWDQFTENYIGGDTAFANLDTRQRMNSQEFIGAIVSECACRENRMNGALKNESTNVVTGARRFNAKAKAPLINQISQRSGPSKDKEGQGAFCKLCKKSTHKTDDCPRWEDLQCEYCHRPGHREDDCWHKHKEKRPDYMGNKNNSSNPRKRIRQETHQGETNETAAREFDKEITFHAEITSGPSHAGYTADSSVKITPWEDDLLDADDIAQSPILPDTTAYEEVLYGEEDTVSLGENEETDFYNYGATVNTVVYNNNGNNRSLYDWIADCATTSHICNKREAFTEYVPVHTEISIYGVGNTTTRAQGRGTVIIEATHDGKQHKLTLKNVLHVPNNRHNLLSLGRWARAGGTFKGGPEITLTSPNGSPIASGPLANNNLYKLRFKYVNYSNDENNRIARPHYSFSTQAQTLTWEAWHRHFGHVSYSGLTRLHTQNMVNRFIVDTNSPKPECPACIAAKHSEKPFGPATKRVSQPGELTHADLWGKYDIASINASQYYLLLIDDATCYITVRFLKTKDQAAQQIKNHFTHLSVHGKQPRAIQINRGTEFVNQDLMTWCETRGIDVQRTAPYSPSQNGIAERMN